MKKILAVMLCLVMVLGVFAGCGDKKDNATDGSGSADLMNNTARKEGNTWI